MIVLLLYRNAEDGIWDNGLELEERGVRDQSQAFEEGLVHSRNKNLDIYRYDYMFEDLYNSINVNK